MVLTCDIGLRVPKRLPDDARPEAFATACTELMVCLQSANDVHALLFSEHLCRLREVLKYEDRGASEHDGCEAFEDEDPCPSRDTGDTIHIVNRCGK